jgi:hypothetical protein
MSQKNQIAINIPAADLANINSLVSQLKTALAPYVHALTADEIKSISKMGDKTVAFVDKVKDYTTSNPEFVPANIMSVADFVVDVNAVKTLSPISKSIGQINDDLQDTLILCGNEALVPALMYYGNVKFNAANGVASAKTIYEDLQKRFPGRSKKASITAV